MDQYRVEKVVGREEWKGNQGKMVGWKLIVRNLATDRDGNASINSIPANSYKAGDQFWADALGERDGFLKLKRVAPPQGAVAPPRLETLEEGRRSGNPPLQLHGYAPEHPQTRMYDNAIPYSKALAAYKRFAQDLDTEHGYNYTYATTLFLAWLNGKVADPSDIDLGF